MARSRREAEKQEAEELQGEQCAATEEEHFMAITHAMAMFGVGGGCEGTYKGLARVSKMLEKIHGYDHWECPDDDPIMVESLMRALALKAEEDAILGRGEDQQ